MTNESLKKAEILLEALPYIRTFQGQTLVIKYGGAAMQEPELKRAFAQDITLLQYLGIHPVVVHGGGPQIGKVLAKMDIPTRFVDGMRITDAGTMDVVEMVLAGKINKEIVNLINTAGGAAVGLSGKDGLLLQAQKLEFYRPRDDEPPEIIDIGLVGEVTAVNTNLIRTLQGPALHPGDRPGGGGGSGRNLQYQRRPGGRGGGRGPGRGQAHPAHRRPGGPGPGGPAGFQPHPPPGVTLIEEGTIAGGMIPKVKCCLEALDEGVAKAHILDGRALHALLLEIFTDTGIGTEIVG